MQRIAGPQRVGGALASVLRNAPPAHRGIALVVLPRQSDVDGGDEFIADCHLRRGRGTGHKQRGDRPSGRRKTTHDGLPAGAAALLYIAITVDARPHAAPRSPSIRTRLLPSSALKRGRSRICLTALHAYAVLILRSAAGASRRMATMTEGAHLYVANW